MPRKGPKPFKLPQSRPVQELPVKLTDYAEMIFHGDGILRTVHANSLQQVKHLGQGAYGDVEHKVYIYDDEEGNKVTVDLAVKLIPCSNDEASSKMLNRSLQINTSIGSHPFLVQYYGAMFHAGDVMLCMEKMDMDLDKFYKKLYKIPESSETESVDYSDGSLTPVEPEILLSEDLLAYISYCVISALKYLKTHLQIIHRDVKPSNILTSGNGSVKLCDFGISGPLINSLNGSNIGCNMYLAPERINPPEPNYGFSIKSDVWSLGITIFELATGKFPFRKWLSLWEQLNDVVKNPSPTLSPNSLYSTKLHEVINSCLKKKEIERPDYEKLLSMPFLIDLNLTGSQQKMSQTVLNLLNPSTAVAMDCD